MRLGGFVSLTERESFAVEYWPLELYKLSLRPPPGELQGRSRWSPERPAASAARSCKSSAPPARVWSGSISTATGARRRSKPSATAGSRWPGDVTTEAGVAAAFAAAVDTFGGVDIVVSNAGLASSAPIEETSFADWQRIHAVLMTGYFLAARAAFASCASRIAAGPSSSLVPRTRSSRAEHAAYSAAKAAELHLARCLAEEGGVHGIRVNIVNPDAVIEGSRIWNSSWREERAAAYNITPDELAAYYRDRTTLRVNVLPEDVAEAVLHFASPGAPARARGISSTWTAAWRPPTRGKADAPLSQGDRPAAVVLRGELARKRRARGLKLNYPEARALIADEILEGARDGRSVAELMELGSSI